MRSALALLVIALVAAPTTVRAQTGGTHGSHGEDLIRNALSAAPRAVAEAATVMDANGNVLRTGTNGFVCMPDMPNVPNNTPMCLDQQWNAVITAWMNKEQPEYEGIGIGYMLQGDLPTSNVDPFATAPTEDNQWLQNAGPHIMVLVSDHELLEGMPTDPKNGSPWVMWAGTPYAHIMIPTVPRPVE